MHDFWGSKLIAFQPPLDIQKPGKNIEISTDLTTREPEKTSLFELRKMEETPGCWTALPFLRKSVGLSGNVLQRSRFRFWEIFWEVVLVVAKFHVFFDLWGLHFIKEFNKFKEKRIMLNFELEKSIFLRIPKIQLFAAKINIISTLGSLRID